MIHCIHTGIAAITRNVFTTFDGNTYIFSGKCNYLLTGDLMDGNFSIMVHFTGKMRKTIIVLTSQHELQLYSRKKVSTILFVLCLRREIFLQ